MLIGNRFPINSFMQTVDIDVKYIVLFITCKIFGVLCSFVSKYMFMIYDRYDKLSFLLYKYLVFMF